MEISQQSPFSDLRRTVSEVVARFVTEPFAESTPLITSGLVDSIGLVDLIVALEEEFHLTISTAEAQPENFDSVDQIARLIQGKL